MKPVLYAEDSADDAYFMRYAWRQARIPNRLIWVADGREAIHYLAGEHIFSNRAEHPLPCLLLLDLKLPGKDGFEVLEWIRQQSHLASLKVVIVSGSNQTGDMDRARELGANDYVVKCSPPQGLLDIILRKKEEWLSEPVIRGNA